MVQDFWRSVYYQHVTYSLQKLVSKYDLLSLYILYNNQHLERNPISYELLFQSYILCIVCIFVLHVTLKFRINMFKLNFTTNQLGVNRKIASETL